MLPGRDGLDVCRDLRAESGVPIVMLTARADTSDVVRGLEAGADDYIVKPFKPAELVARIRARLRHLIGGGTEQLRIDDIEIDVGSHDVRRDGVPMSLTPAGVRPARHPRPHPAPSAHPRGAARPGLGLSACGRHPIGQRARPASAGQGGTRPGAPARRDHRPRGRLSGRTALDGPHLTPSPGELAAQRCADVAAIAAAARRRADPAALQLRRGAARRLPDRPGGSRAAERQAAGRARRRLVRARVRAQPAGFGKRSPIPTASTRWWRRSPPSSAAAAVRAACSTSRSCPPTARSDGYNEQLA